MKKLKLNKLESTVKSSYRTLAIFEFFAETQRAATVAEISGALGLPQSSTSALLKSLVDIAYLSFHPSTRTFEPTMRMAFLSNWTIQKNISAAKLPTLLKQLREQVQETTVLAARNGIYSQYIFVEHFDNLIGRHVETGSVRPLISSATGRSLLRDESDYEIGKIVRKTAHEINDPEWQRKFENALGHIKDVRKSGYAMSKGDTADGAAGLAVNLPNNGNMARLAIAVAGPRERILAKEEKIAPILQNLIKTLPKTITQEILNLI